MMKTRFVLFISFLFLSWVSVSTAQEEKWENAPKTVPHTTQEMQTPGFWINKIKNPESVIMTPQQIEQMNARNRNLPAIIKDIDGNDYNIDDVIAYKLNIGLQFNVAEPLKIKSFPGDSVRAMLKHHKDLLTGRTWYDRREMKYEKDVIDSIIVKMNVQNVPDNIIPKYGILVQQTLNRALPMNQAGYGSSRSWHDQFQSTSLDLAMPVAILHTTADKTWYYVRSEISFGWVSAENVAIGSAKDIEKYADSKNILVACEYNIPVYSDKNFESFILNLFMGSNVKLLSTTDTGFKVLLPIRKPDGSFATTTGWVKKNARVSEGYQQFTQKNVISTMFSLLYRPYGWADSEHEYDCCGSLRVVYRTFGIKMGRWTSFELHSAPHIIAFNKKTPVEKKYEYLKGREPGITLVGNSGHICMYLGDHNGRHYVIHQGGYTYKGEDGILYPYNRVNVNDTELEGGSNIKEFTEISTFKP